MAVIIEGKNKCKICGLSMSSIEELVAFPRLSIDEKDPLYYFDDGVFHKKCFLNFALKNIVIEKLTKEGYDAEYFLNFKT